MCRFTYRNKAIRMVTTMLIVINDYNDNKNKIKCMFGLSLDVNECVSKPCRNGGTCENLQGSYRCKCKAGFLGKHCEIGLYACHLFFFPLALMLLFSLLLPFFFQAFACK